MPLIGPRRILLVEDDLNHRWVMRRILDSAFGDEIAVEEAETGERALERATRKPEIDLILLDLGLPGMGGIEVLKRIRSNPLTRGVPVVVLTSSQEREDIQTAYQHGANSFVSKSETPELMFQRLRMLPVYWLELNQLPRDLQN
ncbi:MAG: response regulator [Acidobacteria bacterium]|nr:response regulator [Acidobacteriota bacterium]MCA1611039.1 response regulator [Acidobacteriota bacterium]